MKLEPAQITKLQEPIPSWAIKPHPTKSNITVIHPMAVIDRLNDVFGVGQWVFRTTYIACNPSIQQTKNGPRDVFMSSVHGTLLVNDYDIHIEQYGGSTNDDMGDALKGGATDALTKCASYLGIGASIYKGQGNAAPPAPSMNAEKAIEMILAAKDLGQLQATWKAIPNGLQKDPEVVAMKDEMKTKLTTND